jgi:hypothetical protein
MSMLETATFRFNPALELVLYDRLEPALQAGLADLRRDPSFYGVLLPADRAPASAATATTKPVDRESALLLLTLRTAGLIPEYVRRMLGPDAWHTITGLVLDGVLEIDHAGAFRSGAAALDVMTLDGYDLGPDLSEPRGLVARLSIDALRHAAALPIDDVAALARRLYGYNRLPLTPSNAAPASATTDFTRLGLDARGVAAMLDRTWTCSSSGADTEWVCWTAPERWESTDATRGTSKLYVSPAPAATREAFAATVSAATAHGALAFKAGAGPYGLLRPDKLVIYFRHREQLHAAAAALTDALDGAPAHGVPFTAAITEDGMLSWAADPPAHAGLVGSTASESWRSWLTAQLAAAVIAGRSPSDTAPNTAPNTVVRFALHRAAALRIDPRTWAPADTVWRGAAS